MPFHLATNWEERISQLEVLTGKFNAIMTRLNLPKDDARTWGFVSILCFCQTIAWIPIRLSQCAEVESNRPFLTRLLGTRNEKALFELLQISHWNARASFITLVQSALENCINQVLDAIDGPKARRKFSKSAKRLIELTKMRSPDRKYKIVMVPAWIRNCLHAAGRHSYPSTIVQIDFARYVFRQGRQFKCGSWSHLFHAVLHALDVYEKMLCSPIVKSIDRIPP
jgi:hypothetical protein